jgi:uncharacterized membrane protein
MLLGSGVLHFAVPKPYDGIVPKSLPGNARTYTYASGVAELGIGAGLLIPRYRRLSAGLAALIFIAVFPANVQMAVDWWRSEKIPMALKIGAILRLPLQIPMVTESLKARRNAV